MVPLKTQAYRTLGYLHNPGSQSGMIEMANIGSISLRIPYRDVSHARPRWADPITLEFALLRSYYLR